MKLMYAPASPFARKVRVAAIELGLGDAVELVFTKVSPGSPNEAYARNYNPLRKIPALELEDSTVLYDSTVICEYLDARAGGGIIPGVDDDRWRVLTRHALAQGMCDAAILLRYELGCGPRKCAGRRGSRSSGARFGTASSGSRPTRRARRDP